MVSEYQQKAAMAAMAAMAAVGDLEDQGVLVGEATLRQQTLNLLAMGDEVVMAAMAAVGDGVAMAAVVAWLPSY